MQVPDPVRRFLGRKWAPGPLSPMLVFSPGSHEMLEPPDPGPTEPGSALHAGASGAVREHALCSVRSWFD